MSAGGTVRGQDAPPEPTVPFPILPGDIGGQECTTLASDADSVSVSCTPTPAEGDGSVLPGLAAVSLLVAWAVIAAYAGTDMRRRGHPGVLWTILVFVTGPIGVAIWLLMRGNYKPLPVSPEPPESPYGPGVRPGSLPWSDWGSTTDR